MEGTQMEKKVLLLIPHQSETSVDVDESGNLWIEQIKDDGERDVILIRPWMLEAFKAAVERA